MTIRTIVFAPSSILKATEEHSLILKKTLKLLGRNYNWGRYRCKFYFNFKPVTSSGWSASIILIRLLNLYKTYSAGSVGLEHHFIFKGMRLKIVAEMTKSFFFFFFSLNLFMPVTVIILTFHCRIHILEMTLNLIQSAEEWDA